MRERYKYARFGGTLLYRYGETFFPTEPTAKKSLASWHLGTDIHCQHQLGKKQSSQHKKCISISVYQCIKYQFDRIPFYWKSVVTALLHHVCSNSLRNRRSEKFGAQLTPHACIFPSADMQTFSLQAVVHCWHLIFQETGMYVCEQ